MFYQGLFCVCVCDCYRTVHCDLIFKGQNIMLLDFLTLKVGQLHCPEMWEPISQCHCIISHKNRYLINPAVLTKKIIYNYFQICSQYLN